MHRRWLILAVLFVARTAMGFQYQSVASSAPLLLRDLHVGFAEIGTLIGLYHISGVVLSLPGELIIRRLGDKRLCALSGFRSWRAADWSWRMRTASPSHSLGGCAAAWEPRCSTW